MLAKSKQKQKILVILGPTSTGKTDLALEMAKNLNGELVACDSRQIYKGLDIGTGKLPGQDVEIEKGEGFWKMSGIKVWMYDVVEPKKQYTVFDYVKDTSRVIDDITTRSKLPIIIGGTGLYRKALLEGLPNLAFPLNLRLRKELEKLSLQKLQDRLQKLSTKKWGEMNDSDRHNPRRLIRYIELASVLDAQKILCSFQNDNCIINNLNILKIGLTAPREALYKRIDERVVVRVGQGMVNEAERLYKKGLGLKRMRQLGLEYGILADYFNGKITSQEELIEKLQFKIHGYARRQITWFKKETDICWFDITRNDWLEKVERRIDSWYYATDDQTN